MKAFFLSHYIQIIAITSKDMDHREIIPNTQKV